MFRILNKAPIHYGLELNTETANYNITNKCHEPWKN